MVVKCKRCKEPITVDDKFIYKEDKDGKEVKKVVFLHCCLKQVGVIKE